MTDHGERSQGSPGHRFGKRWPIALSVVVLTTGCATRTHIPFVGPDPSLEGTAVATIRTEPRFAYESEPIAAETSVIEKNSLYEHRRLSFPSIAENGQSDNLVTVDYHRSRLPGTHPVVVILPIWGRHVYPSNAITRTLRKRSNGTVHILNVMGESTFVDWPGLEVATDEDQFMELWAEGAQREITTVIDMRRLLDWTEGQPEIDGSRIGLIGFSHGALFAPTLAAQEPRIFTLVLVMGGAHPQRVAARCRGTRTEGVQIWAEETFGWSRNEMEDRLEPLIGPMDPARYPPRVNPERVLMIEAGNDECIPESCRDDLWEIMGRPERIIINANHRHAFYTMTPLNFNWMQKRIWSFIEPRLLESPTRSNSDRR